MNSNLMYFCSVALSILATAFMARCEYLRERFAGELLSKSQRQIRQVGTGYELAVAVVPRLDLRPARGTYAASRVQ